MERRRALDGYLPDRVERSKTVVFPRDDIIDLLTAGTGEKVQASTTTAFTRLLRVLLKEPELGPRVVPIIPDEARTFGIDALFAEFKIYAPFGQQYEPVDAGLMLSYREANDGQILEEGITEAGAMAELTAAATAYATWGQPMIPFFIFYSMFGFQRVGDLIWSFGDQRGRGFLLGATAGRTTLYGRRACSTATGSRRCTRSRIPTAARTTPRSRTKSAVLVRDGIRRMYGPEPEDCFYYLTLYNENYVQPPMPEGVEDGIVRGMYLLPPAAEGARAPRADPRERPDGAAGARSAADARRAPRRRAPTCGAFPAGSSCATTRSSASGGTGCTRPSRRARRTSPSSCQRRKARRRGHRLGAGRARRDRPLRAPAVRGARHRRLRVLRRPAARCGATSRSTPRTWWSACSTGSPRPATSRAKPWPRRSSATRSTPTPRTLG